jgi:hypothetical protein
MADDELKDPMIAKVAEFAGAPVALSEDFDARVMALVEQSRDSRPATRGPHWSHALLAASIAALMLGSAWIGRITAPRTAPAASEIATGAEGPTVEFRISAPGASTVALVGDFNEWNTSATPLRATERDGVWSVTIPLAPGRHEYAFVVDGQRWLADPAAPRAPSSDFGTPNSVVTVMGQS